MRTDAVMMRILGIPLLAASALVAVVLVGVPRAAADNGPSGAETIAVTIPPSGSVTCKRGDTTLPPNSTVHRGDRLHCTATGFAASEAIVVAIHSPIRTLGRVTASASGQAVYEYSVAEDLAAGAHSLSFTGQQSKTVAIYPFVVVVGHGPSAGGAGGHGGGIAFTGLNVLGLLIVALALIAAGAALHRRRLEREHV
jgi:hypothetical protein